MATSVSKTVTYEGMDYSGSVTTTISGNTVTVKYSVTAPSNWMKVKVWLNGSEYWLVSSVPWSGTKTLTKTLTISGPSTIGCAMGIIHPDTGSNVKTIIPNTNLSQTPASYKVAYNANGGTGAPSSQTKYYGTAIKLSATKPSRTGYTFAKWTTAANGTGTSYAPGASYTANAAATLYAQWTANKYTVSYDANGGTGAPAAQTKTYGQSMTITSAEPTRARYRFLGWSESKTAGTAQYSAGGAYNKAITSNVTLYAVWELAYQPPVVSKVTVVRCDADGNDADDGTYARVSAVWSVDTVYDASNIGTVVGRYAAQGSEDYTEFSMEPNGTASGTATAIVPNMSADVQYLITATASDAVEIGGVRYTGERSAVLTKAAFTLDFHAGGRGIGIGCASPSEGIDFGFDLVFRGAVDFVSRLASHVTHRFVSSLRSSGESEAAANEYSNALQLWDADEADYFGILQAAKMTNGEGVIIGGHRTVGGSNKYNMLQLLVNKDGTQVVSVSEGAAWRKALNMSASSATIAGMADDFSLSTSAAKIPLSNFSESDPDGLFSASSNGIKVAASGTILVIATAYFYTGFTDNDLAVISVYKNSSGVCEHGARVGGSSPYQSAFCSTMVDVSEGDVIYLYARNSTAARGIVKNYPSRTFIKAAYLRRA